MKGTFTLGAEDLCEYYVGYLGIADLSSRTGYLYLGRIAGQESLRNEPREGSRIRETVAVYGLENKT